MKYVCEKDHCKWAVLDGTGKKGICSIRNCPYRRVKKPSLEIKWAGLINNEKERKYSYGKKIWTPEMVKDLKQMYNNGKGIEAIAVQLGISYYLVNNKISELIKSGELSKRDRAIFWTDEKESKLKEMYSNGYKHEEIAKQLNTTIQATTSRIAKLKRSGELSKHDRATFWTDERDALLKDMYKRGYTQVNMAKALGKSKGTINNRIVKLRAMGELDE